MPRPLGHLRALFSARVLLDLEEADRVFREKGVQAYTDYLRCEGDYAGQGDAALGGFRKLGKGPLFDVALALSKLNQKEPIVEIGLTCKDELPSASAIFENLMATALGDTLEYDVATSGLPVDEKIHKAFKTDIFFTRSAADAQTAIDLNIAAAIINFPPQGTYDYEAGGPVRIIVDGDAVAFGDSAEVGFRKDVASLPNDYSGAIAQYKTREHQERNTPVEPGPFTRVLAKISELNSRFPADEQPFQIGLLTARGALSSRRAVTTLQQYGIKFNYPSAFVGGSDKSDWLEAHKPHLFFDDQEAHLKRGMVFCPTGLVPYKTGGAMHQYQLEQKQKVAGSPTAQSFDKAAQGVLAPADEQDNNGPPAVWPYPTDKNPDNKPA